MNGIMKAMGKLLRIAAPLAVIAILVGVGYWLISQAHFPWFEPGGLVAGQEKGLFIFTCILSLFVVLPVFFMLFFFAWKYREGNEKAEYHPEWSNNKKLELLWWGIPIAIIVVLSAVTWVTSHTLDPAKTIQPGTKPLEVQVVALQWKWLFIYPEQKIATVNELELPVNRPIHFDITSDAPMSAFWVPALGSQIYAMTGMDTQLNLMAQKTGTYRGANTNINGEGYAEMNFPVPVVDANDFNKWVGTHQTASNTLDWGTYQTLMQPNIPSGPSYYRVTDISVYNRVIMKYMQPMKEGKA